MSKEDKTMNTTTRTFEIQRSQHVLSGMPVVALPEDIKACYIEMNGKRYYLDDTTDEGIAECDGSKSKIL